MESLGTVRLRVTLIATAAVGAVLLISSLGLVTIQRSLLTHGIDEALRQRADNVRTEVVSRTDGTPLRGEGDSEDSFLQLVDQTGTVVASTPNMTGVAAAVQVTSFDPARPIQTVRGLPLSNSDFRVLARPMATAATGPQTLLLGKNLDDVEESVNSLTISLAVFGPLVLTLLALLVWWLTGRVLRPVEAVRAEVAAIEGNQLHRRVPVPGTRDEISRLAQTMNAMLDRVEEAIQRQRGFVADASHELRGPLTRLRSEIEVALAHPNAQDPESLHRSLLGAVIELQQLVNDLLFLARSESDSIGGATGPVDLDDLVLAEARRLRARARVRVDTSGISAARTTGDAHQLARAIANLASNAERHARAVVTFEVRERADRSEVVVADDGPGIPPEHHEIVFKRFTRLDAARSRDAGGAGLGLAIVQDIVTRHGGTILIAASNGSGARFEMALPRAD